MRSHSPAALFSAFVLALAVSACASTQSPQEAVVVTQPAAAAVTTETAVVTVPTEIVTLHPALIKAWQGTDPAAFEVYYTPTAVVVTPEKTFTGWTEIQTGWIAPGLPGMSKFMAVPSAFTREGTDIVETGSYSFTMTSEGKAEDMKGTYTQRWQKQPDGSWRIVKVEVK